MGNVSAKVPDHRPEMQAAIKRLQAAKVETEAIACCERDLWKATEGLRTVMINSIDAHRHEDEAVQKACRDATDKRKLAEIPYPKIEKAKQATDKKKKQLTQAEQAHKKALDKLLAAMNKQTGHLHCKLKEAEGDEAKQIKGLIAATQASQAKVIQGASTVLVNGKAYREKLTADRKTAEKQLKQAEKQQAALKKKMKGKKK